LPRSKRRSAPAVTSSPIATLRALPGKIQTGSTCYSQVWHRIFADGRTWSRECRSFLRHGSSPRIAHEPLPGTSTTIHRVEPAFISRTSVMLVPNRGCVSSHCELYQKMHSDSCGFRIEPNGYAHFSVATQGKLHLPRHATFRGEAAGYRPKYRRSAPTRWRR